VYAHARTRGLSLHDAIHDLLDTNELKPKVKTVLASLMQDFTRWRTSMASVPHTVLAATVLDESGYIAMWQADKAPDSPGRIENLKELVTGISSFESIPEFLEHVSLVMERHEGSEKTSISIMTLHGAKGLEFDAVFLTGWEEGLFPSQKTMDEHGVKGLEEERRLAYVGITRARRRAYVSFAARRRQYGNWVDALPSRFIDELPSAHTEATTEPGLYGGDRSSHWDSSGIRPAAPAPIPRIRQQNLSPEMGITTPAGFQRGTRIFHDKFGAGTVYNVDGHKLDIKFDVGGPKRVMDSFVNKVEE
jgi:DNA helicase-2/ATP-dependent DNA helicase PcrA